MIGTAHEDKFTPECRRARAKAHDVCVWTISRLGDFNTECGKVYGVDHDSVMPKENHNRKGNEMKITKTHYAIPTAFDYNENGRGGPIALITLEGHVCRVPFYCTPEELESLISFGRCKLTITIEEESR